jgi:hypothetical protein
MLLQIDEREGQVLLEMLESALWTLREVDTAGYEAMRHEREAVMLGLRERRAAPPSRVPVDTSDVHRVLA